MLQRAFAIVLSVMMALASDAAGQLSTAFTYQGELRSGGALVTGVYDARFRLFDAGVAGSGVGAQLCVNNVDVVDGRFTVTLDFGTQFNGQARYLEVEVRDGNGVGCANPGGFVILSPRSEVMATPYAIYAQGAAVAASAQNALQLNGQPASHYTNAANLTGTLPGGGLAGSYTGAVNLGNAGNTVAGTFTGNGSGLLQLNAGALTTGVISPARGGTGTSVTTAAMDSVLKWNGSAWVAGPDLNFAPVAGAGLALSGSTLSIGTGAVTAAMLGPDSVTNVNVVDGSLRKEDMQANTAFIAHVTSNTMYLAQGRLAIGLNANVDSFPDHELVVQGSAEVESDLFVGGEVTTAPLTRTKVISALEFQSNSALSKALNGVYGTTVGNAIQLYAPLNLPNGATIVSVKYWYTDTSVTDMSLGMGQQVFSIGAAYACGVDATSTGNGAGTRSVVFVPTSRFVVDHEDGPHALSVNWTVPAIPSSMAVEGAVVTYTTTGAIP